MSIDDRIWLFEQLFCQTNVYALYVFVWLIIFLNKKKRNEYTRLLGFFLFAFVIDESAQNKVCDLPSAKFVSKREKKRRWNHL